MRPPTTLLLHSLRRAARAPVPPTVRHLRQSSSKPSKPSPKASKPPSSHDDHTPSRLPNLYTSRAPASDDRGPPPSETTTTDFGALDVLAGATPPANAIEACLPDGFMLDSGADVRGGAGVLLVQGEVFRWEPWRAAAEKGMVNERGQFELPREAWGVLECVWPKPELLVLGLGASMLPLAPSTRRHISDLGIRVDVQDSRNAAAQFNLLATERGVETVAAALVPIGWRAGKR